MVPSLDTPIHIKVCLYVGILCLASLLLASVFKNKASTLRSQVALKDDDSVIPSEYDFFQSSKCLGAPFLYVTVHDKTQNVLKYTRDGCFISDSVLVMDRDAGGDDVEFRSMAIGKHKDHEALFIADASNDNSRLLVFGKCIEEGYNYGRRPYLETVVQSIQNIGVDHTYGVCLDKEGNVYISNQHTDCVLRFQVGNFRAMALPRSLQLDQRLDYYDGTFVQFGLPRQHDRGEQGIRAIASVKTKIWIAHEDLSGVAVTDIDSGLVTDVISLDTPVGLHYDEGDGIVFVSCKSKDRGGIIYAIDPQSYKILNSYVHHKMAHPSGMTSYDGILFVAEQNKGAILTFDIKSGDFIRKIVKSGDPRIVMIEQLALSPC